MRFTHRLTTTLAVLGLLAAAATGSAGTAGAATVAPTSPTTAGAHTYAFALPATGATQSTGTLAWNNTTWALTLTASTGQLAAGTCVTVYFDWRAAGHHDARGLRDCVSNDTYTYSFSDNSTGNLVGGPGRMGICYGKQDTTGTCSYYTVSSGAVATSSTLSTPPIQMAWSGWPHAGWAYPCVLSWTTRASNGAVSTFLDAHSRQRVLVGTSC